MKKLLVSLAALALLGAACSSNTTIDTDAVVAAVEADDGNAANSTTQGSTDSNEGDTGADDSDGTQGSSDDPPAPADPTAVPADDPPAAADAPDETETETDDDDDGDGDSGSNELPDFVVGDDWCTAAAFIDDNFDGLDDVNFGDPEELERTYTRSLELVKSIAVIAPPEISADVQLTIEGFTTLTAALENADWMFLDLDLSVIDGLDDNGMELAGYNIEKYNFTVCGVGEDPGEPPTPRVDTPVDPDADNGGGDTTLPVEGTIREQAIAEFVAAGFTPEEAECIFGGMDLTNPAALQDTSALLSLFTECGISLDRLSQLGG